MKKLILISGDLAAGKSTLARNLSTKLGIPCFIKDEMKEIICDNVGFSNREENRKNSKATMCMMSYIFKQYSILKEDLILEANFRDEEIEEIENIANQNGYKIYKILLTGDAKLLYERFLKRLPFRNDAHKSQHLEKDFNKYVEVLQTFRKVALQRGFIEIDITNMNETDVFNYVRKKVL